VRRTSLRVGDNPGEAVAKCYAITRVFSDTMLSAAGRRATGANVKELLQIRDAVASPLQLRHLDARYRLFAPSQRQNEVAPGL
jgi:hypothetical protein